jgi:small acid-soluble spore protein F (minor alpha/beta-type SASP)
MYKITNEKQIKCFSEEDFVMSRRKTMMSEALKEEIAKELGVYEKVKQDGGWQNVSSKDCGNIVSKAIEIANRKVEE